MIARLVMVIFSRKELSIKFAREMMICNSTELNNNNKNAKRFKV